MRKSKKLIKSYIGGTHRETTRKKGKKHQIMKPSIKANKHHPNFENYSAKYAYQLGKQKNLPKNVKEYRPNLQQYQENESQGASVHSLLFPKN